MPIVIATLFYLMISLQNRKMGLYILLWLLPLYVVRFNIGPLPSTWLEIMAIISIILWLIDLKHEKIRRGLKERLQKNNLVFILITAVFILGATISVFTAVDIQKAAGLWKAFYIEPVLLYFVFITRFRNRHHWHHAIVSLAISAIGVSALAIYQKFTGWMIFNPFWQAEETRRVTSIFGFPNGIGLYLGPLVPLFVGEAHRLFKKLISTKEKLPTNRILGTFTIKVRQLDYFTLAIYSTATLTSLLAIWWARSTGALIALAGVALVAALINPKIRLYATVACALGIIIFVLLPSGNAIKQELLFKDLSGQIRTSMWAETIDFLKDHPLRGAGMASYQARMPEYHKMPVEIFHHPHNIFLNFWAETGLIGLIGFVGILYYFWVLAKQKLARAAPSRRFALYALAALLAILIHGMVDTPYIKNDLSIMFWFVLALGLSAHKK